jgi:uroporphyrinogen decarboxylase
MFGYDPPGHLQLRGVGWTYPAYEPAFEEKIIEDRGAYEVVQDDAGRHVLFFKGRRDGFMPEYLAHPMTDAKSWEEECKWRLDPGTPARYSDLDDRMAKARAGAGQGMMIQQGLAGAGMYLRALLGTTNMMYAFHDMPALLHDVMQTWLELADAVIARHQEYVTLDEIWLSEDICYKNGPLVSPEIMAEFFFPYYQQLLANVKARQLDKSRHLYVQIDTDGYCPPTIQLYIEAIDMDVMSPFEVAAGCDVVAIGREYPGLAMCGGIDKRELARGKAAIDRIVEAILPTMRERGGYLPTCDHGVPEEVSLADYMHYRKRCLELGG